ncbi:MAG TPA: DUF3224 domain-containing protein [Baekduia sp.]|uniref:DUF3224 domain-containing protein n=1 Tax=Baekduia sp. TaxID=2600305 RepID=UPI002D79EB17|nr:DUF3224 domain-containing protein [Baekduia sp.]HET6507799.1 DUF3224 domain-containing protein [Baekduia sp.]
MRADATFTVAEFTPAPVPASDVTTALPVGVATMTKTFTGAIEGRAATIFTSAFDADKGLGTYVALESFTGTVDGRAGAFNFVHSASTSGEDRSNEVFFIVPDSGTDELAGLTGTGGIAIDADRTHRIWLDYQL